MSGLWPPAERLLRRRARFNSDGDRGWHMADSCREIQGLPAPMLPIRGDAPHVRTGRVQASSGTRRGIATSLSGQVSVSARIGGENSWPLMIRRPRPSSVQRPRVRNEFNGGRGRLHLSATQPSNAFMGPKGDMSSTCRTTANYSFFPEANDSRFFFLMRRSMDFAVGRSTITGMFVRLILRDNI